MIALGTRCAALFFSLVLVTVACSDSTASPEDDAAQAESTTPAVAGTSAAATASPTSEAPTSAPLTSEAPTTGPSAPAEYDFSSVSPIVETFLDDKGLNGAGMIVVHREDGVIYHDHWGGFSEDRISLIASSSKMVTAGVLLRLQDDGLLDVDAPVADVAEWGAGNPDITPGQLVSNSSGLVGLGPDPTYGPYLCQYIASFTLQDCAAAIFTTPDDDTEITPPDVAFNYGGGQWQVAGAVAEAASGKSWAELIDEIYVKPCGLEAFGYNNHFAILEGGGFTHPNNFDSNPGQLPATENPNMEGGAYTTTGDYGKLLLMHLQGGRCGDEQVLSQESLDLLHADRIAEAYDGDAWDPETGYGMGWWVDRPTGRLNDGGAYGSVPWLDLEDGYGAFLVIEDTSGTGNELANMLYDIVEEAATNPS